MDGVDRLLELLEEEERVLKDLLVQAQEKCEVLVKGDFARLEKLIDVEGNLLAKTGVLEEERLQLQDRLAEELSAEGSRVEEIAGVVDGPQAEALRKVALRLTERARDLVELNSLNERIIRNNLKLIDLVLRAGREAETYRSDATGRSGEDQVLDRKS